MFRPCIYTILIAYHLYDVTSVTPEEKTPALAPDEKFRDLYPLTSSNFTSKLLHSKDAWVVVFHNGSLDVQWKTMATHLRGICWVGVVDNTTETELVKHLKFDAANEVARVYPYGNQKRKWQSVKSQNEARSAAVASLPDKTIKIQKDGINDFMTEALMSSPSRFPVYFISDEEEAPAFIKALVLRFEKYFHFGRLVKPSNEEFKQIGLGDKFVSPPALYVIVFQDGNVEKVSAIQFDPERNGYMNYTNILQFLFAVNSEFRYQLPGDNQSSSKQEAEMTDILEIEAERFEFVYMESNKSVSEKVEDKGKDGLVPESTIQESAKLNKDEL